MFFAAIREQRYSTPPVPNRTRHWALAEAVGCFISQHGGIAKPRTLATLRRFPGLLTGRQGTTGDHTGPHKWRFEGPYQYHDSMGWVAHGRLDCLPDTCLEERIVLVTMHAHLSHVFSTWLHALCAMCCRLLQRLAASYVKKCLVL
jgi:hypothetical protein